MQKFSLKWHHYLNCSLLVLTLLAVGETKALAQGTFNVLTRNYNNQRTGANLSETQLNISNVNSSQFGKLFMLSVDDQVYTGILYVSSLQIAGGTHNVIYAATNNNTVYAFDADTLGPPLWSRNLNGIGRPLMNTDVGQNCGTYNDYRGNIGIVGTPVIDPSADTIYLVSRTIENGNGVQRLWALDITTGLDRANSPQIIQATFTPSGGLATPFGSLTENQRPALALSQGTVYVAWSSYCDTTPYDGWVLTYDSTSLAQVGAFMSNGQAGIWMAGAGPVFDASGNTYYSTGNGNWDGITGFGESLVKLASRTLGVLDYFTPSDYNTLNGNDLDFGSAGPSMLPGTNLLVSGGKDGKIYLLNTTGLGHEVSGDVQISQWFQAVDTTVRPGSTHHIHNASPLWNSPEGLNLYVWGENDFLHLYQFNPSKQTFNTPPLVTASILPPVGMPGGMLSISANGGQAGTGVVWASVPRNGNANQFTVPGNLYAFNAENLSLLYSSTGTGDDLLNFSKGSAPVVANGKVYVGSLSRFVTVYGPKGSAAPSQDLALNQTATSTTPCNSSETAAQAVNGSFSAGLNDKWCSSVSSPWLMVDLGSAQNISRVVVEHAGAGGEALNLNTLAFNIQIGTDGVNFNTVANVTGNIDSITTHDFAPTTARFVLLNIITPTSTSDTSARIYELQVFAAPASASADFAISAKPGSQTVYAGTGTSFTSSAVALGGFPGNITFSASGLPAGATASFSPTSVNGSGDSNVAISTSCATPPGTYTVDLVGTSGGLKHSAPVTIVVRPVTNLCQVYNRVGIVTDGSTFSSGWGLDLGGHGYSSTLLGSSVSFQNTSFAIGPPNLPDTVSSVTIPVTPGQYSQFTILATGVNANQTSQTFTVNYADGTNSTFTQSLSDWHTPQNYPGESLAVTMAYRDDFDGTTDNRAFYLYGYSFVLNPAKTLNGIVLPNNNDVVVVALSLTTSASSPDFSMEAGPASQTVTQGSGTSYTATVTALNSFSGSVSLSASGLPSGASATFNPTSVTGSGSSTVNISTSSSTPGGSYPVTITGTSGSLQHSTNVTLIVNGTSSTGVEVNLSSYYNVSGIVTDGTTFSATGGLDRGGHAYSANLLGSAVNFQNSTLAIGPANAPDAVTSTTIALPAGQFSTLTMLATGVNGLQPSQTFTVTYTDSTNSTFTQSISDWFAPQNYPGESKVMVMAYRDASNGTKNTGAYNLFGYSFALNNTKTVSSITLPNNSNVVLLAVTLTPASAGPDFSIAAVPASQTVTVGGGTSYTATVTAMGGFSGSVSLSASGLPSGASATFNPTSVTGSGSSTVNISTLSSTAAGSYPVTITGTSGTLRHTANVTLVVSATGVTSIEVNLSAFYNVSGVVTDGTTFAANGGLDKSGSAYSANLLGSAVNFQNSTLAIGPANAPDAVTSTTVALPAGQFSTLTMLATGMNGLQPSQTFTVTYTDTTTSTFTQSISDWFAPQNYPGESKAVTMAYRDLSNGTKDNRTFYLYGYSFALNNTKTVSSFTLPNNNNVVLLAVTLTPATLGPDFSIAATPASHTVTMGSGTSYTATVTALNGFSGSVSLSASGLPSGASATFNPTSVTGSGTSTVSISTLSTTPAGSYPVTITGTSGNLQHTASVTLVVTGFSIAAAPASQTVTVGGGTSYTATVTALNGFSGSVSLSASGLPGGASATFNPTSVTGSGTSTVNISTSSSTPVGSYPVTITGTSGTLQQTASVTLVVTGFSIAAVPASQTVTVGGGTSYTATVTALNGFSGSVSLSASGLPAGASATFNPTSVTGSGSSTVSISTLSTTPAGSYPVTITGTSGTLQHSAGVTLVVNGMSSAAVEVNLSPYYNVSGIVTDGTTFGATGGLDRGGNAYSANLLGSAVNFQNSTLAIGPANAPDAVTSTTVALPAGQFSTLIMLATGVNGLQPSQTFTVTYTDNTNSTFTQSISDWFAPQNYPGESKAMVMAYRDASNGTKNAGTYNLFGYSFALNNTKTVSSITLPNNSNVVLLAVTLTTASAGPDFSIAAAPASQTVTQGSGTSYTATVTALNGFSGSASLSASGLPSGASATFNPTSMTGSGSSTVNISTLSSTAAGSYPVTITGTSGTLQHSTSVTLVVNATNSVAVEVNLSASYNVSGTVTDGTTFSATGGLDKSGSAYSANLLGSAVNFLNSTLAIGPANAPDAVTSTTVALPAGQFSTLTMLASGVNGLQPSQTFTVTYTDTTTSTFTQSISDWFAPQNYPGESKAVIMAYRDLSNGTKDNRTFYLYGYSFALNNTKTVSSITLPHNNNLSVFAITLTP